MILVNRVWHAVVATLNSLLKQHELHMKEHSSLSFGNLNLYYSVTKLPVIIRACPYIPAFVENRPYNALFLL